MAQATNPKKDKNSKKAAKATNPANNPVANPNDGGNKFFMLAIGAILVLGIAAVAVVVSTREKAHYDGPQTAVAEVEGQALPPLVESGVSIDPEADPTIGTQLPIMTGTDFSDNPITIENDGRAKVIYFLAHWCGFCQEEVPVLVELDEAGERPENLDVYGVSSLVDASRGSYPPVRWLDVEGWTFPTIRDDDESSMFGTMGGQGTPYTIYVDANNTIVARSSGTVGAEVTKELWNLAATAG